MYCDAKEFISGTVKSINTLSEIKANPPIKENGNICNCNGNCGDNCKCKKYNNYSATEIQTKL